MALLRWPYSRCVSLSFGTGDHTRSAGILVVARGFDAGIAAALLCLAAGALLPEGAHGWSDPALIAAGAVLMAEKPWVPTTQ